MVAEGGCVWVDVLCLEVEWKRREVEVREVVDVVVWSLEENEGDEYL